MSEPGGRPAERVAERREGFDAALRRADGRAQGREAARAREGAVRGAARRAGEGEAARRASGRRGEGALLRLASWRGAKGAADPSPSPRAAAGAGGAGGAAMQPGPLALEPARVTLALAVRALVPSIEAFRLGGREALALDFGRALGVELRRTPGGVELALHVAPGLAPAARAELAGLLRTLAARGVAVARAEVRERGAPERRGR